MKIKTILKKAYFGGSVALAYLIVLYVFWPDKGIFYVLSSDKGIFGNRFEFLYFPLKTIFKTYCFLGTGKFNFSCSSNDFGDLFAFPFLTLLTGIILGAVYGCIKVYRGKGNY